MTPKGRATALRIRHARSARRARRRRSVRPPDNTWMNFVTAPVTSESAGDEADGPDSQRLYDQAMEVSHGICDQFHHISH